MKFLVRAWSQRNWALAFMGVAGSVMLGMATLLAIQVLFSCRMDVRGFWCASISGIRVFSVGSKLGIGMSFEPIFSVMTIAWWNAAYEDFNSCDIWEGTSAPPLLETMEVDQGMRLKVLRGCRRKHDWLEAKAKNPNKRRTESWALL